MEIRKYFLEQIEKNLLDKLKKILLQSRENDQVFKIFALIFEFLGKHIKSLFFYLKFMERQKKINIFYGRLNFLLCWYSTFEKKSEIISKILLRKNFFCLELLFFYSKYFIQFGKKESSKIFHRKILYMSRKKKLEEFEIKKNNPLSFFFLINFAERFKILENKKEKDNLFFFCFELFKNKEKKILYIFFNNIIRNNNFMELKRGNLNFFLKNLNVKYTEKSPLIFRKLKKILEIVKKIPNSFPIKKIINIVKKNYKWFSCFIVLLSKKKKKNYNKIFISKYFNSILERAFQSYNSIFRNINYTLNFLRKIAKLQYKNFLIAESMFTFKLIFRTNSGHIESLRIISLIKKKLFSDKIGSNIFIKGLKSLVKKKCTINRKLFARKRYNFDFYMMAEIFFEENKIFALSNLVLSFMVLKNQKFKNLIKLRKNNGKKKSDVLLENICQEKNFFSQIRLLKNTVEKKRKNNAFTKNFWSISKLENFIFLFILKKDIFYKEKILSKLFCSKFFISYGSVFLKTCCAFMFIKKKKFQQAYKITRFQCLNNPFSYQQWSLLTKLENKIGIMTSKTLRYSLRILMKNPTSIPAIIFTGNHCSAFGSFGYSLAEFFHAYRWHKGSSFLNFTICLQYINGSSSRKIKNLEFINFLGLSFFSEYQKLRNFIIETYLRKKHQRFELQIEIIYNTARLYLFLGLEWLAFKTFKKGLTISNSYLSLTKKRRYSQKVFETRLIKEIIFNIGILSYGSGMKKTLI